MKSHEDRDTGERERERETDRGTETERDRDRDREGQRLFTIGGQLKIIKYLSFSDASQPIRAGAANRQAQPSSR